MAETEPTRKLARNSLINFFGYTAPLAVAAVSIPLMIRSIGAERFGILSLAWVLIGYLSLFDLGLSRALTKLVSEKLGQSRHDDIPELIWTAVCMMAALGLTVAIASGLCLSFIVQKFLNIPENLENETLNAFYLLILTLPMVIPSIGLRGVLDAFERFDLSNAVRIPLGVYTFLSPLAVIPFSTSLFPIVGVLVIGRLASCAAHLVFCFRIVPEMSWNIALNRDMIAPLFRFGSWMTVTNIVQPLMVYSDRFLIGSLVSMSAVAYYATPNEVITKLWLFPIALTGVFFPAFSSTFVKNREDTVLLFDKGMKYIFAAVYPISLMIIVFAKEGLMLWLGEAFARNSTSVLQWMTIAVFVHSLGNMPYSLIQGIGRPDLTGKLHLIELPFYLLMLQQFVRHYGIIGAAIAWLIRIFADAAIMQVMALHLLNTRMNLYHLLIFIAACLTFLIGAFLSAIYLKIIFLCVTLSVFLSAVWFLFLNNEERLRIKAKFYGF